jgi:uncharacterized protein YkwD
MGVVFMTMAKTRSRLTASLLALALALSLVMSFSVTVSAQTAYPNRSTEATCLNAQEKQFLTLINNYRASKGLKALKASKSLNISSYTHSLDMAKRKYFSHDTKLPLPAGQSGAKFTNRMSDAGYTYSTYKGENIAAGYSTAQAVFNAWKASSGHNANMLNGKYTVIGIGLSTVSGSPYTNYWTTDFGGYTDAASTC